MDGGKTAYAVCCNTVRPVRPIARRKAKGAGLRAESGAMALLSEKARS